MTIEKTQWLGKYTSISLCTNNILDNGFVTSDNKLPCVRVLT